MTFQYFTTGIYPIPQLSTSAKRGEKTQLMRVPIQCNAGDLIEADAIQCVSTNETDTSALATVALFCSQNKDENNPGMYAQMFTPWAGTNIMVDEHHHTFMRSGKLIAPWGGTLAAPLWVIFCCAYDGDPQITHDATIELGYGKIDVKVTPVAL